MGKIVSNLQRGMPAHFLSFAGPQQVTPYQEDEVVLVVSPGHPLAGAGQVELAMLRQLRFVSLQKSSTVQGIRNILQNHGVVWSSLQVVMVRCPPPR